MMAWMTRAKTAGAKGRHGKSDTGRAVRPAGRPAQDGLLGKRVRRVNDPALATMVTWQITDLRTLGDGLPYAILRSSHDTKLEKAIALSGLLDPRIYKIF